MSTDDRNTFDLLGEQVKNTNQSTSIPSQQARLRNYLRGLPSLELSDKGRAHVCQRFQVSEQELQVAIADQQSRTGQSAHGLLHLTTTALSDQVSASGGAAEC